MTTLISSNKRDCRFFAVGRFADSINRARRFTTTVDAGFIGTARPCAASLNAVC